METLLPLLGFAIATSATPGPNTLMVAASAANHGLRAVVPHVLGIAFGFAAMIWLAGLYMLHTWGELCLSPIGLSLVNKLAHTSRKRPCLRNLSTFKRSFSERTRDVLDPGAGSR